MPFMRPSLPAVDRLLAGPDTRRAAMWLKTRKLNALLEPLAAVIGGASADGRVTGAYGGYAVEARPHSGYPIKHMSNPGATGPEPVNMLRVTLSGVAGRQAWHCQSSASSPLQDLASRFTAGRLLARFKPGEFRFEGADPLNDSLQGMAEKLVKAFGVPLTAGADPALQERLVGAGLFDELDLLRLGHHPYLPKVRFTPSARALAEQWHPSSGRPSLPAAQLEEAERDDPGRLELEVEAAKARVLSPEQFRHVLEHAARIAAINAGVNHD
jgi:hypothetical protein